MEELLTIPPHSYALITHLDRVNPPRCWIPEKESKEHHLMYAGARNLIDQLLALKAEEESQR